MALTNTQYDELMRRYNQKQWNAHQKAAQTKHRVYASLPQLAQLDEKIASTSVRRAKEYIGGNMAALAGLDEEIAQLSKEKLQLLADAGYPADVFEPQYECKDCQDTGYINNKKCHCFLQAELEYIYSQSNIKTLLEKENFNTFSLSYYPEDMVDPVSGKSSLQLATAALEKCKTFVADFATSSDNLLLYGNTGAGKTFLTNCIAKELLEEGYSVIYFSAFQLFDLLAKYTFDKGTSDSQYQNIFNCDLLIIDDLGTEAPNSFTVAKFFQCINERQLRGRSTIISTNLAPKDIPNIYSERVSSRITSNYTLVKMFGRDVRILKKLSGK